jgi:hypothetical protein
MTTIRHSVLALAILACTALPAAAQLGGLLGGAKPAAASGNIDQDVKSFLDKSGAIEGTLLTASSAIADAYASEEERAKMASIRDAVGKATDPKEAAAKRAEGIQTAQAIAKRNAGAEDLNAKTNALSDNKKQLLAKGVALFLSGALQAKDLVPSGQGVVSSVSGNPMAIGKVMPVKDALPRLSNAVSFAAESTPKLIKALQGAKVKVVEPKSSTEKVAAISPEEFGAN